MARNRRSTIPSGSHDLRYWMFYCASSICRLWTLLPRKWRVLFDDLDEDVRRFTSSFCTWQGNASSGASNIGYRALSHPWSPNGWTLICFRLCALLLYPLAPLAQKRYCSSFFPFLIPTRSRKSHHGRHERAGGGQVLQQQLCGGLSIELFAICAFNVSPITSWCSRSSANCTTMI